MNKKLTISGLAILLAGIAPLQAASGEKAISIPSQVTQEKIHFPILSTGKHKPPTVLLDETPRVLDSLQNAFSLYSTDQRPLVWDPSINKLALILRGSHAADVDPVDNLNNLFIYRSDDIGKTWMAKIGPVDPDIGDSRYPSVMIVPQDGDIAYYANFPVTSGTGWGEMGYGIIPESNPSFAAALSSNGIQKGATLYPWGSGALMAPNADTSKFFVVGTVSAPSSDVSGTDNNNIGLRMLDADQFDIKESIPDQWVSNKFADPGNATSRTSTVAGVDFKNGKAYVGVFGRFNASDDPTTPTVGVSTSTDGGQTWTEFDILPESVKIDYGAQNGAVNPDSVLFTFNTATDFVVTGDDSFSFLTTMIESGPAPYSETLHDLVEIYKANGQWGIRKVADVDLTAIVPMSLYANAADEQNPDSLSTNQRGNEAQFAITADGTRMIAKWIDWRGSLVYNTVLPNQGDGQAPDTTNISDIFFSVRDVGSSTWTTPMKLTDDNVLDKVTWIPPIIPNDLKGIPLLMVQSAIERNDNPTAGDIMNEMRIVSIPQYVMYTTFDASVAVGVEETIAEEGKMLGLATPNPASSVARIDFTLPAGGHVTLELYNAMGQKVLSLFEGQAQAGTNRVDVNTQNLPVGAYYYRLSWNGTTETRMLNVVR